MNPLVERFAADDAIGARFRHGRAPMRARLAAVAEAFVTGMRRGFDADGGPADLTDFDEDRRAFALEGVGGAATMLDETDRAAPSRLSMLLDGAAPAVATLYAVGAGWAMARLGRSRRQPRGLMADLGDAVDDGYGFAQGLFHSYRFEGPKRFAAASAGADRGLGRSLWFIRGGQAAPIAEACAGFGADRRAAVWRGVGVAAAFAGGADRGELVALVAAAGRYRASVAEGAALAFALRSELGNVPPHTRAALGVLDREGAS